MGRGGGGAGSRVLASTELVKRLVAVRQCKVCTKLFTLALRYTLYVTMDFKPSINVLFGHYSLPRRRILTKLGRTKFEKTT